MLVFVVVAKKLSFTRAATYLGVSKSAVSQQISQLESELGASLIHRTTRGVSLTAIGERVYLSCEFLQNEVESIFKDIDDELENPRGRFTITFPHALESNVVAPAIQRLCQEFPGLEPKLIASDTTLDLVANNIDISIRAGELSDSSYRALPVGNMTEIFCACPDYLQNNRVENLAQLQEHNWIASNWQKRNMQVSCTTNNELHTVSLNEFARVSALPTGIDMALRQMGIILLPRLTAKKLIEQGRLANVMEHIVGPCWPVYAIHAYQNRKPIYATRFYQLICQFFQSL